MGWVLIIICFIIAMAAAIFPIIPGVLFMVLGYLIYGWFYTFENMGVFFWIFQTIFIVLIFIADWIFSAWMVRKFGGSKRSEWGGTLGMLVGPWVTLGVMLGTFIGAMFAEYSVNRDWKKSLKVGAAALLGFFLSGIAKIGLQSIMIIQFLFTVL